MAAIAALSLLAPAFAQQPASAESSQSVLARYVEASKAQQQKLRGTSMRVDILAALPKLKKQGAMHAVRGITRLGRITYDAIRFEGDNTVKKEVIARYLAAEVEQSSKAEAPPLTPDFYKFSYKGLVEREGSEVYLLLVSPKKKLAGTFKGELWLDKDTYLPVREAGRLSKSPSVFVKRFDFVRTYIIRDGVALPKHTRGVVQTRLWGNAEMDVDYSNHSRMSEEADAEHQGIVTEETLARTPI